MDWTYDDGGRAEAGFKGSTGDCVTRSIAIATGTEYKIIYDILNEIASRERQRKRERRNSNSRLGVHRHTYEKFLFELDWYWEPTMGIGQGCRVHLTEDEVPSIGTVLVAVSKHLTVIIDGVIHDTHDPSRGGSRCVYGMYQKAIR